MPNPSGGLFSTAADMDRFYQMILNGGELDGHRIVSADAVRQMTSVQTGDLATGFTPGNGWGLGWCIVREPQGVTGMLSPGTFGHGGAYGTQGWVDPVKQRIFVLMFQRGDIGNSDGSDIRKEFQQAAVDGLETSSLRKVCRRQIDYLYGYRFGESRRGCKLKAIANDHVAGSGTSETTLPLPLP